MCPKKATVAKSYKRKVQLSLIGENYDHIEFSTFVSKEIEYETDQDIFDVLKPLTDIVVNEVESDIEKTFVKIIDMLKDEDNSALVGISDRFERYDEIKGITVKKENKVVKEEAVKEEEVKKEVQEKESSDDDIFSILEGGEDSSTSDDKKVWAEENKDKTPEEVDLDDFNPDDYDDL